MSKGPKPRDYGLDSDHSLSTAAFTGMDPDTPFTDAELGDALLEMVHERALQNRRREYNNAVAEHHWGKSNR